MFRFACLDEVRRGLALDAAQSCVASQSLLRPRVCGLEEGESLFQVQAFLHPRWNHLVGVERKNSAESGEPIHAMPSNNASSRRLSERVVVRLDGKSVV